MNKDAETIDYSALQNVTKQKMPNTLAIVLLSVGAIFLLSFVALASIALFLVIILVVLSAAVAARFILKAKLGKATDKQANSLASFAQMNGFAYAPTFKGSELGSIFTTGHSREAKNNISGQFRNLPFNLYTYSYTEGRINIQVTTNIQTLELTLPSRMPHMVIDSLAESGSTIPVSFNALQRIELQGELGNYFALYAADKQAADTLSKIAPGIMDAIKSHTAKCDVEIIDNKTYLYWSEMPTKQADYHAIFSTASAILSTLEAAFGGGKTPAQEQALENVHSDTTEVERLKTDKPSKKLALAFTAAGVLMCMIVIFPKSVWAFLSLVLGFLLLIISAAVALRRNIKESARAKKLLNK